MSKLGFLHPSQQLIYAPALSWGLCSFESFLTSRRLSQNLQYVLGIVYLIFYTQP